MPSMSETKFKIIVASYNCSDKIIDCLTSVYNQSYKNYDICVIDDGSPDQVNTAAILLFDSMFKFPGMTSFHLRTDNKGALTSQIEGIESLGCEDSDVIVFLDGDDRFSDDRALFDLNQVYASSPDLLMTYGSYLPVPYSSTCPPAKPYPKECIQGNDYRNMTRWGILFNHLRTFKYEVFRQIPRQDLREDDGSYYQVAGDTALMIPALELSGSRHAFLKRAFVHYTSDSMQADWRLYPKEINRIHDRIANCAKLSPI